MGKYYKTDPFKSRAASTRMLLHVLAGEPGKVPARMLAELYRGTRAPDIMNCPGIDFSQISEMCKQVYQAPCMTCGKCYRNSKSKGVVIAEKPYHLQQHLLFQLVGKQDFLQLLNNSFISE